MARVEPRRMTEEMAIRNLLSATPRSCLRRHFGRSPGRLGLADLRACHSSGHLAGAAAAVEVVPGLETPTALVYELCCSPTSLKHRPEGRRHQKRTRRPVYGSFQAKVHSELTEEAGVAALEIRRRGRMKIMRTPV